MKSSDLEGFTDWTEWNSAAQKLAPRKPGLYAFRLSNQFFGRLLGESDLLYIGCTEKRTLRMRLNEHSSAHDGGRGLGCQLTRLNDGGGKIEVAWRVCDAINEAKNLESELLASYERDHAESPPFNRVRSGKRFTDTVDAIHQLLPDLPRTTIANHVSQLVRAETRVRAV